MTELILKTGRSSAIAIADYGPTVYCPEACNAGDILICQLGDQDGDSFVLPAGWYEIFQDGSSGNWTQAYFWYRCDGTETSSTNWDFLSLLLSGSGTAGVISRWSGCATTGVPYESVAGIAVSQMTAPKLLAVRPTTADDSLAVAFVSMEDNTGYSGASNFTEAYDLSSTLGGDMELMCFYQQVTTSTPVPGDTLSTTNEYIGQMTLVLRSTTVYPGLETERVQRL